MKVLNVISVTILFLSMHIQLHAQKKLPNIQVQNLNGKTVNIQTLQESGKPMLISFWATWCKPCIKELDAINEALEDWNDELEVTVIAVSIDDARSYPRIRPFVNGRAWEMEIYIDKNADLKRALGVNNIPHVFIINTEGEIVWQHASYNAGDEETYYDILLGLSHKTSKK